MSKSEIMEADQFFDEIKRDYAEFDWVLTSYMYSHTLNYRGDCDPKDIEREGDMEYFEEKYKSDFKIGYDLRNKKFNEIRAGEEIRRGIKADRAYIENLINGKASTGVCWTYNDEARSVSNSSFYRHIECELTAVLISEDSIDEKASQLLGFRYEIEGEVRLNYGTKILLKSIKIVNNLSLKSEDRTYNDGNIYQINKIVSTGDLKTKGDKELFKKMEGI